VFAINDHGCYIRSGLYRYHTHVLKGSGSGQWQVMTMHDFIDAETATQQQQQH
jgi:hypothetical protein